MVVRRQTTCTFPIHSKIFRYFKQCTREFYLRLKILTKISLSVHIYLLTPCSRVLLETLTVSQLVKKFPVFYVTRRFITAFTSVRHLSLSWASSIQFIPPHPTSWRFILILSSHLRLGLPSGLFPSDFPTKTLYMPLLSPIRATYSAYDNLLDLITRTIFGEVYRSLSSSLCSLPHSPVTLSLLGPNIFLSTLFSNNLSLSFSLIESDQVSHPYKTTDKIIFQCFLFFIFFDSKLEDNRFCTEWQQAFPDLNLLLTYSWMQFWSVKADISVPYVLPVDI